MPEVSTIGSIFILYALIFVKYLFFASGFFDMQFILSTFLMGVLTWMNSCSDKLTDEMKDVGKFLGHILFVSLTYSILSSILSTIYSMVFYFGFVNTIILSNISVMLIMSGLVKLFRKQLVDNLSKSSAGNKFLDFINYYYNTYVIGKKLGEKILTNAKFIFNSYLLVYGKIIYHKFVSVNNELSDNNKSKELKIKLQEKYTGAKKYINEQYMQPHFARSFQNSLENDPFGMGLSSSTVSKIPYKNIPFSKDINMSLLKSLAQNPDDDFDDLDDDLDQTTIPEVSSQQIEEAEKLDQELIAASKPKELTIEEKRAALRKKMADKKAERTGVSRNNRVVRTQKQQKSNQKDFSDMMNSSGMNMMMDKLLQEDNLEKLMKQFSDDKSGMQMPKFDPAQLKQLLKNQKTN